MRHQRQAARWWHPDKGGTAETFQCFQQLVDILTDTRNQGRKKYIEHVKTEKELRAEDSGADQTISEREWLTINKRFIKGHEARRKLAIKVGKLSKVRVCGLEKKPELNGKEGVCEEWLPATSRWRVRVGDKSYDLKPENLEGADATPEGKSEEDPTMLHVFLDASGSIEPNLDFAKKALLGVFPRLAMTPTAIHKIGTINGEMGSKILFKHTEELEGKEAAVLSTWVADAPGTYLWEYVYEQVKDYSDAEHEVIIITDGFDNSSPAPFDGLEGFNTLMERMKGKRIRISLILIGNTLGQQDANAYRDLCLATGGIYCHAKDTHCSDSSYALVVKDFVAPLLLPDGERHALYRHQRLQYQKMLEDGNARSFPWYLPLEDAPTGSNPTLQTVSQDIGACTGRTPTQFKPSARVTVTEYK